MTAVIGRSDDEWAAEVERLHQRCASLERDVSNNAALAREATGLRQQLEGAVERAEKAEAKLGKLHAELRERRTEVARTHAPWGQ